MDLQIKSKLEREGWSLQPLALDQILQAVGNLQESERPDFELAVRTELLDSDIKKVGSRCLPDALSLSKTRILQGVRVLQILSVIDITQGSKQDVARGNREPRLLRFQFSDGHSTVTAIEFHPIPSVSQDLPPGTKVVLGSSVPVHSGILLLDVNCIRVLGGHVQLLYDAWEMDRKYSKVAVTGLSKTILPEGVPGPPPFKGLQLGRKTRPLTLGASQTNRQEVTDRTIHEEDSSKGVSASRHVRTDTPPPNLVKKLDTPCKPKQAIRPGAEPYRPRGGLAAKDYLSESKPSSVEEEPSLSSNNDATGSVSKSSSLQSSVSEKARAETLDSEQVVSDTPSAAAPSRGSLELKVDDRLKAIDENIKNAISLGLNTAPLQNQRAAQKLLNKSIDRTQARGDGRGSEGRGRRGGHRGGRGFRVSEDDTAVMTIDEWEAKKSNEFRSVKAPIVESSGTDEELARRLQAQLDLENAPVVSSKEIDAAEQLRLSMFTFTPGNPEHENDTRGRGRGRGRGRVSGRGRGLRLGRGSRQG